MRQRLIDNARRTLGAARHPTSLAALDRVDHPLTGAADSCWVDDLVASCPDGPRGLLAIAGCPVPSPRSPASGRLSR